jgi:hypothetical protein
LRKDYFTKTTMGKAQKLDSVFILHFALMKSETVTLESYSKTIDEKVTLATSLITYLDSLAVSAMVLNDNSGRRASAVSLKETIQKKLVEIKEQKTSYEALTKALSDVQSNPDVLLTNAQTHLTKYKGSLECKEIDEKMNSWINEHLNTKIAQLPTRSISELAQQYTLWYNIKTRLATRPDLVAIVNAFLVGDKDKQDGILDKEGFKSDFEKTVKEAFLREIRFYNKKYSGLANTPELSLGSTQIETEEAEGSKDMNLSISGTGEVSYGALGYKAKTYRYGLSANSSVSRNYFTGKDVTGTPSISCIEER